MTEEISYTHKYELQNRENFNKTLIYLNCIADKKTPIRNYRNWQYYLNENYQIIARIDPNNMKIELTNFLENGHTKIIEKKLGVEAF